MVSDAIFDVMASSSWSERRWPERRHGARAPGKVAAARARRSGSCSCLNFSGVRTYAQYDKSMPVPSPSPSSPILTARVRLHVLRYHVWRLSELSDVQRPYNFNDFAGGFDVVTYGVTNGALGNVWWWDVQTWCFSQLGVFSYDGLQWIVVFVHDRDRV